MEIMIDLPLEFDMQVNLAYLLRDTNECIFEIEGEKIRRVITVGGKHFFIEISMNNIRQLVVSFLGEVKPENEWERDTVIAYVREWLDLERELSPFYEMAEADFLLKKPVQLFY